MNDEIKQLLQLSRTERSVDAANPWQDDKLERKAIAEKLTRIIDGEPGHLTISVHGPWGTGKTFLLKRWRQQLENDKIKCIYFNAWSDDFHGEPLVAMIGQLAESLAGEEYEEIIALIKKSVIPLIGYAADLSIGVPISDGIKKLHDAVTDKKMDDYYKQAATKRELSKKLKEMAGKVKTETGKPLIFIIDELDRCRPTFAVELLERVKHIFDIPNIIFVFGVNRTELCKAVESVYGAIDSDTYLRRFFDLSLTLPAASADKFCGYLAQEYNLHKFFAEASEIGDSAHQFAYKNLMKGLTTFVKFMELSLRDIDNCLKAVVLEGKNLNVKNRNSIIVIVPLIVLRLKNRSLYERFLQGKCFSGEVMDYFDAQIPELAGQDKDVQHTMGSIEYHLIWMDNRNSVIPNHLARIESEVEKWRTRMPSDSAYFSSKAKSGDGARRKFLDEVFFDGFVKREHMPPDINYLASLIDLVTIEHH